MGDMALQLRLQLRDQMGARATRALEDVRRAAGGASTAASALGRNTAALGRVNFNGMVQGLKRVEQAATAAMRGLKRMGGTASEVMKAAGGVGAGAMAGGFVAGRALAPAISYESKLASMANVAFNDRDAAGRMAGMKELDAAVKRATDVGGGSREQAADALNTMLAMGMKSDTATNLLPQLQKAATASGADVNELAQVVMKGMEQGFFTEAQVGEAIDKAVKAGEAGQFELKDMARWLPQIMANAKGMKGMAGYEAILASLQGVSVVTGTNDQAGNALFNLLGKVTSADTALDFKKQGIDLHGTLAKATANGQLPLDAFVELVERQVVGKDKRFQSIKAQMATAKDGEKKALMEQAADLLQGSAIGNVVQDREASLALAAMLTQKQRIAEVKGQLGEALGAVDTSFAVMSNTSDFKLQQAKNEVESARSRMLADVKPALDGAVAGATGLANQFPKLTTVAMEASTAIGVMAAAAAAYGGAGVLMGRGGAGGVGRPRDEHGRFIKPEAGAAGSATGRAGAFKAGAKAGGLLALAGAGVNAVMTESSDMSRAEKNAAHMGTAGGAVGTMAGTAVGAALGSVVPVVGTAIGGVLGGMAGGWLGDMLGQKLGDLIFKDESTVRVESVVQVDGRELARAVNEVNGRDAARGR